MAHLNAEWQARLVAFAWLLAAVAISHIAHYVLHALFRRLSLRRHSIVAEEIVTQTQQVSRWMFLLIAVSMVLPKFDVPDWLADPLEHGFEIGYIIVIAWLAIGVIEVFNALVKTTICRKTSRTM